jgi:hypothetical protein
MLGFRNSSRSSSEPYLVSAGVAMSVCTPIPITDDADLALPIASQNAIS